MNRELTELAQALKSYKLARQRRKAADKILEQGAATATLTSLHPHQPAATITFYRDLPHERAVGQNIADDVAGLAFSQEQDALKDVAYWAREVALVYDKEQQRLATMDAPLTHPGEAVNP